MFNLALYPAMRRQLILILCLVHYFTALAAGSIKPGNHNIPAFIWTKSPNGAWTAPPAPKDEHKINIVVDLGPAAEGIVFKWNVPHNNWQSNYSIKLLNQNNAPIPEDQNQRGSGKQNIVLIIKSIKDPGPKTQPISIEISHFTPPGTDKKNSGVVIYSGESKRDASTPQTTAPPHPTARPINQTQKLQRLLLRKKIQIPILTGIIGKGNGSFATNRINFINGGFYITDPFGNIINGPKNK